MYTLSLPLKWRILSNQDRNGHVAFRCVLGDAFPLLIIYNFLLFWYTCLRVHGRKYSEHPRNMTDMLEGQFRQRDTTVSHRCLNESTCDVILTYRIQKEFHNRGASVGSNLRPMNIVIFPKYDGNRRVTPKNDGNLRVTIQLNPPLTICIIITVLSWNLVYVYTVLNIFIIFLLYFDIRTPLSEHLGLLKKSLSKYFLVRNMTKTAVLHSNWARQSHTFEMDVWYGRLKWTFAMDVWNGRLK